MVLTLVAERREPSGESLVYKAATVGLAPLRYTADSKAERREPSGASFINKVATVGLAPLRYNADSKDTVGLAP